MMGFANTCSRSHFYVATSSRVLLIVCSLVIFGCGGPEDSGDSASTEIVIPAELTTEPTAQRIAELTELGRSAFTAKGCVACHLANGEALTGPALANIYGQEIKLADGRKVMRDMPYLYRSMVVPNEYKTQTGHLSMPPYAYLDEQTLVSLVYYVRSLSVESDEGSIQEGSGSDE